MNFFYQTFSFNHLKFILSQGSNSHHQLGIENPKSFYRFRFLISDVLSVRTSDTFTILQKDDQKLYFTGYGLKRSCKKFERFNLKNIVSYSTGRDHCLFMNGKSSQIFFWIIMKK